MFGIALNKKDTYNDTALNDFSLYGLSNLDSEGGRSLVNHLSRFDEDSEKHTTYSTIIKKPFGSENRGRVKVAFYSTPNYYSSDAEGRQAMVGDGKGAVWRQAAKTSLVQDYADNSKSLNHNNKRFKYRHNYSIHDLFVDKSEIDIYFDDRDVMDPEINNDEWEDYDIGLWDSYTSENTDEVRSRDAYIDYWKKISSCEELVFDGDKLTSQLDAEALLNFDSDNDAYRGTRNSNYIQFLTAHNTPTNPLSNVEFNYYKSNNNTNPGFRNKIVYQKKNTLSDYLKIQNTSSRTLEKTLNDEPYLTELGFEDYNTVSLFADDISERQSSLLSDISGDSHQSENSRTSEILEYSYAQKSGYWFTPSSALKYSLLSYAEVDEIFSYLTPPVNQPFPHIHTNPVIDFFLIIYEALLVQTNYIRTLFILLSEALKLFVNSFFDYYESSTDPELAIGYAYYAVVIGARFLFPYFYTNASAFNGGYYLRSYRLNSYYADLFDYLVPA